MGNVVPFPASAEQEQHRALARFLRGMLNASDLHAFAARAAQYLEAEGLQNVVVGWRINDGVLHAHDWSKVREGDEQLAVEARTRATCIADAANRRVACPVHIDEGRFGIGFIADATPGAQERMAALCEVLTPLAETRFEKTRLTESLHELAQSEQLKSALFEIADMASSDMDLDRMLRELHAIVGRFMYADNFYIALFDEQADALRFIYLVDTEDPVIRNADEFIPMAVMERGLTWYLIRDRKPLMGSIPDIRKQLSGPMRDIGADSYDWLGVPVMFGERVRGVLVVQSYVERPRYTPADQALLSYVGSHILTALDRKMAQDELERRVEERTQALQAEVQERQRSVRVQETLYRIAELTNTAMNLDEFYAAVHGIVGELIDARNFYIATVSEDGQTLHFPYFVDQFGTVAESRPMGLGITEYVIRRGKPWLIDARDPVTIAEMRRLDETGQMTWFGPEFHAWLGVPLVQGDRVLGLLTVQSYTPEVGYSERDRDLLTFISYQVASGLERQRAAAELKNAYADLERRVAERTVELSEQIHVREKIEHALKHQVLHDSLTGLPNRAYLRDQLSRALAQARREAGYQFAVLFIDLDRFKVINDSVGHLVGDALLQEVAARFTRCVRAGTDMVARLGGDEFAILMETQAPEDALRMAQRVIEALGEPVRVEGKDLFTGASVGIALSSSNYASPEDVLRDADIAMYRAKSGGRHRFEVFDEELHDQALALLETESELRHGLTRQEFIPFFQPIVRLDDGSIVGYEALMRWKHPEKGILAPGAFLPTAEASGIMEALDWQLFDAALRVAPQLLHGDQYVNLNFSARHFRSPDLDARFLALVASHGVRPGQVRIEITEGALLENPEQIGLVFKRLHENGVHVALDDFGTGYSSLSYLHRFNMHTLKIDRSFIGDLRMDEDRSSTAVVRAILALSESQRMEVVAEGIETDEQRHALLALGCVFGQGYFFARPASLEDILARREPPARNA